MSTSQSIESAQRKSLTNVTNHSILNVVRSVCMLVFLPLFFWPATRICWWDTCWNTLRIILVFPMGPPTHRPCLNTAEKSISNQSQVESFPRERERGRPTLWEKTFVGDIVCSMIVFPIMDFYSLSYPRNGRCRNCIRCFDPWDAKAKQGLQ